MRHYEVSFIVDPVLSGDEIKATAQTYVDMLKNEGATIVHVEDIGLKPLAYSINKRSSGIYFCIEFTFESGTIDKMELALRRDERIMRFLTVSLDKFGVKYNEDKRAGKIGKKARKETEAVVERMSRTETPAAVAEPKVAAAAVAAPLVAAALVAEPEVVAEPVAEAPVEAAPAVVETPVVEEALAVQATEAAEVPAAVEEAPEAEEAPVAEDAAPEAEAEVAEEPVAAADSEVSVASDEAEAPAFNQEEE